MWLIPPHAFEISLWRDCTPCTPSRCYCRAATSPNISTTPKLASAVNIPSYARSSHSGEGMGQASLDEDDMLEDDFQTLHTLVCCVVWQEDDGCRCPAKGRSESSRGSPGQQAEYQVDIGEEGTHLKWLTLLGGPPAGFSWRSRASQTMRCSDMNSTYLSWWGPRVWPCHQPGASSPFGSGVLRSRGGTFAHPL